jgi:hypothetical protein
MTYTAHFIRFFDAKTGKTFHDDGYHYRDFFNNDVDDLGDDRETAEQWMKDGYKGPDIDGIGVEWEVVEA